MFSHYVRHAFVKKSESKEKKVQNYLAHERIFIIFAA